MISLSYHIIVLYIMSQVQLSDLAFELFDHDNGHREFRDVVFEDVVFEHNIINRLLTLDN